MIYDVQDISFSVPTNDRYENFSPGDWIKNKVGGYVNDAVLTNLKNRLGVDPSQAVSDIMSGIIGGDLSPIQQYLSKLTNPTNKDQDADKNKSTTGTATTATGTTGKSDWLGNIGQFIKEHPWITAGSALTAMNLLSKGLMPKAQMSYGYGMPQMPMMYPMMMPQMQPMMTANYGYGYGNGLQSILNTIAPIVTGYGVSKFLNNKPATASSQPTVSEESTTASSDLDMADEYAQELMEMYPDKAPEIESALGKYAKRYPNNPSRIVTGLKVLGMKYGSEANKKAQEQETPEANNTEGQGEDYIDDSNETKVREGLNRLGWTHPIKNFQQWRAEKKLDTLMAMHSPEVREQIAEDILRKEGRKKTPISKIIKNYGVKPEDTLGYKLKLAGGKAKKIAGAGIKKGAEAVKDTIDWIKDKYNATGAPRKPLYK